MDADDRMALAEEANSLPLHVQMCSMRHRQIMATVSALDRMARDRMEAQAVRLKRIEAAAYGILTLMAGGGAFTVAQVAPVLRVLAGQ